MKSLSRDERPSKPSAPAVLPRTARPPRAIPKPMNFLLWLLLVSVLSIVLLNYYSRCEPASKGRGLVAPAYYSLCASGATSRIDPKRHKSALTRAPTVETLGIPHTTPFQTSFKNPLQSHFRRDNLRPDKLFTKFLGGLRGRYWTLISSQDKTGLT